MSSKKKILLAQLAARGDCLYATAIARQIKHDYPDCHLTWAIGSMCKDIINNNPHIDAIWEIPISNHSEVAAAWEKFEKEAMGLKKAGSFDEVFFTQISPNNFQNFDGTVRASIFRGYPHPITVPISPVVNLTATEVERVHAFAKLHDLKNYSHVVLFEYSSNSGQSFVTPGFAREVCQKIVDVHKDVCIILSSNSPMQRLDRRIIDGSILTFRENIELTRFCTLLIGCSSGISWLCTAQNAKQIPKIQLLKQRQSVFASMIHDFEHFGYSTENVLEMTECQPQKLYECISCIIVDGFAQAKQKFHDKIPLAFDFYFDLTAEMLAKRSIKKYVQSMANVIKRYGITVAFVKAFFIRFPRNLKRLLLGR